MRGWRATAWVFLSAATGKSGPFDFVHNHNAIIKVIRGCIRIDTIDWSSVWNLTEINSIPVVLVVVFCVVFFFHAIFPECENQATFPLHFTAEIFTRHWQHKAATGSMCCFTTACDKVSGPVLFDVAAGVIWFPSSRWSSFLGRSQVLFFNCVFPIYAEQR